MQKALHRQHRIDDKQAGLCQKHNKLIFAKNETYPLHVNLCQRLYVNMT